MNSGVHLGFFFNIILVQHNLLILFSFWILKIDLIFQKVFCAIKWNNLNFMFKKIQKLCLSCMIGNIWNLLKHWLHMNEWLSKHLLMLKIYFLMLFATFEMFKLLKLCTDTEILKNHHTIGPLNTIPKCL